MFYRVRADSTLQSLVVEFINGNSYITGMRVKANCGMNAKEAFGLEWIGKDQLEVATLKSSLDSTFFQTRT